MLACQRGDPEVVGRNRGTGGPQRGEYVGIVARRTLVGLEDRYAGRSHELRQLFAVPSRAATGHEAGQQLAQNNERQLNFTCRPQSAHGGGVAAHEATVHVGVERDRAHRRGRERRRFTRYAPFGCCAHSAGSIFENGATAASNRSASAVDQQPARASRSSWVSRPPCSRCSVSTMRRLTLMPRRRASALSRESVAASRRRSKTFAILDMISYSYMISRRHE